MIEFWQHLPGSISPYIIQVGSFRVGWYGMMYIVAFTVFYLTGLYRIRRDGVGGYTADFLMDYLVWAAIGLILGARLGYVLFYNFGYYARHPLEVVLPFTFEGGFRFTGISGMSYHGGVIGTFVSSMIFFRRNNASFWRFADTFVFGIPLGFTFGRIGNFINMELYGRATDAPWGMYFPTDPTGSLRHPSQLYESFLEGLFLFSVLWVLRNRRSLRGYMFGLYLAGYAVIRFMIEFFREPDAHLGFVFLKFSMGQVLCVVMLFFAALAAWAGRRHAHEPALHQGAAEPEP